MLPAYFALDAGVAVPTAATAGPWSPDVQHGGAPAALAAWAAEQHPAPGPMRLARLTVDPDSALEGLREPVREERQIQLVRIGLLDRDTEVVRVTALRVRIADLPTPATEHKRPVDPTPEACMPAGAIEHLRSPFVEDIEMKTARGTLQDTGPAAVWYRLRRPILSGTSLPPASRAAIAADFGNGTAAPLEPAAWTFVNADITLQLERDPVGEWILVDAHSRVGPSGSGLTTMRLADLDGTFGCASLSLIINKR